MRTPSVFAESICGLTVVPVAAALLVAALAAFLLMASSAGAVPTVTTDKVEYHPDETALINGTGYASGQLLDIVVIRPDLSIVTGDGTNTPTPPFDFETADGSGSFAYSYILNGIFGLYTVNVYDKADTSHTTLLATTTFLDDAGPVACSGGPTDTSQPGSLYVINGSSTPPVPAGEVVTGICLKAGSLHTGLITADGDIFDRINLCYTVSGIGSDTVTITKVGAGPTCNDISHIDFFTALASTPTPTPSPTPTATLTVTVTTDIHDAAHASVTDVPVGATVHDKATVSGTGPVPTGSVDFTFYTSADCTTGGSPSGTIALVAGVAHPSTSQGPLAAGLYSFKAHYNGDTNYNAADSPCEPLDPVGVMTPTPTGPVGGLVEMVIGSDDSGASGSWIASVLVAFLLAGTTVAGTFAVARVKRRS